MRFNYFIFWIRIAALFLFRSSRSTIALSLMVIVAVATLIFLSALAMGVNDTMVSNSVGLYAGHISGFNVPSSIQPESLQVNGTTSVLHRTVLFGDLAHGNRVYRISLIGVNPQAEKKSTTIWKKTTDGRYPLNNENAIFLSKPLAQGLAVQTGSILMFRSESSNTPVELTVSGIYQTGIDFFDRGLAFCPYTALPQETHTWQAAVFVEKGYNPEAVIAEFQRTLPAGIKFASWKEMMPELVQLIDLNYFSMSIVMVLVFGVVSVGIGCAFVIFILKNIREYGIMKAMGVTSREMTLLILSEVVLMNFLACGVGIVAGILAVVIVGQDGINLGGFTSHNRYFAVSGIIFPRLTLYSLLVPPALAIIFSMLAAVWPAVLVTRKNVANILRIV